MNERIGRDLRSGGRDERRDPDPPPSRWAMWVHRAKTKIHQGRRALEESVANEKVARARQANELRDLPVIAEVASPLWVHEHPAEWELERGKVENLRVACRRIHGAEFPHGGTFSFWAQLGRPTAGRGFVEGRELREGCIVPAVAGGICQLSNALYQAAVDAGLEVVERHPHSRKVPGSAAVDGRDATVFWNYVDLRFAAEVPFRIDAWLTATQLRVAIRAERRRGRRLVASGRVETGGSARRGVDPVSAADRSCASCTRWDCHAHRPAPLSGRRPGITAVLVDAWWPEFDAYLRREASRQARLMVPIDGRRWGKQRYRWDHRGFDVVERFPASTLGRALRSRRLAGQGAARQRALLRFNEQLADAMARRLDPGVTRIVVGLDLLAPLWRGGHLGGRPFDVLMTRSPIAALHTELDRAASLHPGTATLSDFRAPPEYVAAEMLALAAAQRIVTPHAQIAATFGDRALVLPWHLPTRLRSPRTRRTRHRLLFPATTVARKGCHALREALFRIDSASRPRLTVLGRNLEGDDFWSRLALDAVAPTQLLGAAELRWSDYDAVVLPAFVEHQPRLLLEALARGLPVVASTACGLGPLGGVHEIEAGNSSSLAEGLRWALEVAETRRLRE